MMENTYILTAPAGNIKADKVKSKEKIDGTVTTIMTLDYAIRCEMILVLLYMMNVVYFLSKHCSVKMYMSFQ